MVYWTIKGAEREKQHEDLPSVLHWSQFSRETFCFPPLSISHPEPFLQNREREIRPTVNQEISHNCTVFYLMKKIGLVLAITFQFVCLHVPFFISWNKFKPILDSESSVYINARYFILHAYCFPIDLIVSGINLFQIKLNRISWSVNMKAFQSN